MMMKQDWHQQVLGGLLGAPSVITRVGPALTSVGHLLRFDLFESFPVTTAKKLHFDQVKRELYCFLKGYTTKKELHEHGVKIWDADMERAGLEGIGPIYGAQWRKWEVYDSLGWSHDFDQLRWAIDELKLTDGTSRRALVSGWNAPRVLSKAAALPPCHVMFQFNVVNGVLYTDVYQRSADAFLGLPFDVASYAIMSRLVANELGEVMSINGEVLNYHIGNLHLYDAHLPAAHEELANEPSGQQVRLNARGANVDTFHYDKCSLVGYHETRSIKAKLLT